MTRRTDDPRPVVGSRGSSHVWPGTPYPHEGSLTAYMLRLCTGLGIMGWHPTPSRPNLALPGVPEIPPTRPDPHCIPGGCP